MKEYNIFLCSSIVEFEEERMKLAAYIQNISNGITQKRFDTAVYLHKCEYMDNALADEGMQKTYNEELCRSELVVFLFGENAGEYTLEELACAAEHFGEDSKNRICVLSRHDPYRAEEGSTLKNLEHMLDKYRLRWVQFENIEGVKLAIAEKLLEQL